MKTKVPNEHPQNLRNIKSFLNCYLLLLYGVDMASMLCDSWHKQIAAVKHHICHLVLGTEATL